MRATRDPSVPVLTAALCWSTLALLCVAADVMPAAFVAASIGGLLMAAELIRMSIPQRYTDPKLIDRLMEQAQAGRKLAIYDRDTGLFAHWYLALRGQEECARAARYKHPLSLLIIEPCPGESTAEWATKSQIAQWMQTELRVTDIASYLGNSRYAVLAPEADASAIQKLVGRLQEKVKSCDVSISAFPEDGLTFQRLWHHASSRISHDRAKAA